MIKQKQEGIKMIKVFIGIAIGITITLLVVKLRNYLIRNNLSLDWSWILSRLAIVLLIIYFIYSSIGIFAGPEYTKPNGNVCRGYKYGFQICSGDINAE